MYFPASQPKQLFEEDHMSQAFGIGRRKLKEKEKQVFDEIVKQCDVSEVNQKIANGEKVIAENHTVPSEYQVVQVSTRMKVQFIK